MQLPDFPRKLGSAQVLIRFGVRLLVLIVFAVFGSIGFGRSLAALLWMSTILSAVVAVIRREPPFDAVLNHWDEMVTYAAMCMLVSGLNQSLLPTRTYAAPMRSSPGHARFHIRPKTYWPRTTLTFGRNTNVKLVEPPSCSSPSAIVFIGRNKRGQWVAQEQNGLYGGLFVNRAQAVKYALFENGHHPETIIELARDIELDMGGAPASSSAIPARRVA